MTSRCGSAAAAERVRSSLDPRQPMPQQSHSAFRAGRAVGQWGIVGRRRIGRECVRDELAYLEERYSEEMAAGLNAQSKAAKVAHFELAYRYAVQARDLRPGLS